MIADLRDTVRLLRLPFSFLLLPIFLLALSQAPVVANHQIFWVALILHGLVYPASNGYNSWIDRDTTPIGGLKSPPPPPRLLFWTTLGLDALALLLSWHIHGYFAAGILLYILASRAYSWDKTRLKQYPIAGFLTIFVFQGLLTYFTALVGLVPSEHWPEIQTWHQAGLAVAAACLIGGVYPLTQIYQHQADALRGDLTLSQWLGYRGTFIFAGSLFALSGGLLGYGLPPKQFILFCLFLSPVLAYFGYWAAQVWRDIQAANFEHTMRLNLLAAVCLNLCFGLMGVVV